MTPTAPRTCLDCQASLAGRHGCARRCVPCALRRQGGWNRRQRVVLGLDGMTKAKPETAAVEPLERAAALYLARYAVPVPDAASPDLVAALQTAVPSGDHNRQCFRCAACGRRIGGLPGLYAHLRGAPHIARLYGVGVAALRQAAVP